MTEKTVKKLIQAAGIFADPAAGPTIALFMNIYDKAFSRYERPDYSLYPGLYCYSRVENEFKRKEISFYDKNIKLQGYYYECENPLGIVITAHGLHCGADDYIPIQKFFYDHSFNVFSFDYKGTYSSEGDSTVGACESLVDLDLAIKFVKENLNFKGLPLFLFGHSWGGYACLASLALHKDIKACASVSSMVDGHTIINDKAKEYAGKMHYLTKPYIVVYQRYLFKNYVDYDAIKGINATSAPIYIAHGTSDKVINYYEQSIFSKKDEIKNPNVTFYQGLGFHGDHNDILLSIDAIAYRHEVESMLKLLEHDKGSLRDEDKREFYKTIDHKRYSSPNLEIMLPILQMFLNALDKK